MAREKDEAKRAAIMAAAKKLFAERGFHGTSIADLAKETGIPVGSVYTYFENKEALLASIIDEGWGEFFEGLERILAVAPSAESKVALIVYRVLPSLLEDVDLISILLSEAAHSVDLEAKLDRLTDSVAAIVQDLARERGITMNFPEGQARAALTLYFLGSLDAVRLAKTAGIKVAIEDITAFIRLSVENAFHFDLDPSLSKLEGE